MWEHVKDLIAVYLSVKLFGNPLGAYLINLMSCITKKGA